MSWSVKETGESKALATKLASQFSSIQVTSEEATLKDAAASIVARALGATAAGVSVTVECSGSGSGKSQTLKLAITPN